MSAKKFLESGHYFDDQGDVDYQIWTVQTFVWVALVSVVKVVQLAIEMNWADFYYNLGSEALSMFNY